MSPAKLQSLLQNGLTHQRAGRFAAAETFYRQARVAAPKNFDVLHLSGLLAHQQGRGAEAIELLRRALALSPQSVMCELRLAIALGAMQRHAEAEKHLRHATTVKADFHEGWDQLATCLKHQDRITEALRCHEQAVALKPDYAAGWVNFGFTLRLAGRQAEALACHERALAAAPDYAPARFGRAQALQQLHRVREAIADYDAFLALRPQAHEARSNRLFALQNLDELSREQLFAEHVAYGRALGGGAPARSFAHSPDPTRRLRVARSFGLNLQPADPVGRELARAKAAPASWQPTLTNPKQKTTLRVAVLSPDLRAHSCAFFIEPLLRHLDRDAFELYLYHDHFREDAVTARLRPLAAVWRNFSGQSNAAVEQVIRGDNLDLLVDLAGHTGMTNRLPVLARKVAPVQVTYLGYPNTTGVPAIDYRFTDAIADPVDDADAFATEALVRFAPTAWTYQPPQDAPDVAPLPAQARGCVTFGSFNDLAKITDAMLATWSRVLAAVPASRLKLKGRGLSEGGVRAALQERLARAGIELARVELLERTPDTVSHLALYHDVDIALDTFPYHGTTTTCEALWMGVPVVTLVGDRHMSRVGASLLTAIGHSEWCATDRDGYVRIATELAGDIARLAAIRAALREDLRASPLLDFAGQAACFGAALRECWAAWCERTTPAELAAL